MGLDFLIPLFPVFLIFRFFAFSGDGPVGERVGAERGLRVLGRSLREAIGRAVYPHWPRNRSLSEAVESVTKAVEAVTLTGQGSGPFSGGGRSRHPGWVVEPDCLWTRDPDPDDRFGPSEWPELGRPRVVFADGRRAWGTNTPMAPPRSAFRARTAVGPGAAFADLEAAISRAGAVAIADWGTTSVSRCAPRALSGKRCYVIFFSTGSRRFSGHAEGGYVVASKTRRDKSLRACGRWSKEGTRGNEEDSRMDEREAARRA